MGAGHAHTAIQTYRQSIDTSQSMKTPANSISHELWVTAASPSPPLLMSSLDRLCGHSVSGSSCCLFPPHLRGTGKRSLFPAFSQPDPPRPRQGSSSCTLCLAPQFLFSHSSSNRATEQASPQNLCSGQRRAAHGEAPRGRECGGGLPTKFCESAKPQAHQMLSLDPFLPLW